MEMFYWVFVLASLGYATATAGSQYEWYDVKGDAGRGDDGGAAVVGGADHDGALYAAAASGGNTDALVSELLSQGSDDDGLTLDLFHNLQEYAKSDKTRSGDYSDDMMAQILAGATKSGGSSYGDFGGDDDDSSEETDSAFDHLKSAANIYAVAKGYAKDAAMALAKAQSDLTAAGSSAMAEAANSAKGAALATIAAAKAEARSNVIKSRNAYVSSLDNLKNKLTVMKLIEKRFRALAVAFSKVRQYAGQALISLRSMTARKDDDDSSESYGYGYSHPKQNILTTVASAKARIAKMKIVEKRFLALAKALAKIRAQSYADVRDVRKNAIGLAKTTTAAQAQVGAAVESAASIVSQAVATARATALATAEATAVAAVDSKIKAEAIVNAAAKVVEGARAQAVEKAAPSLLAKKADYGSSGYGSDQQTAAGSGYGDTHVTDTYS